MSGHDAEHETIRLDDGQTVSGRLQAPSDDFATLALLRPLVRRLGARATLELIDGADHSFRVPGRAGRSNDEGFAGMLDTLTACIKRVRGRAGRT